jgi:hypothetical protein
MVCSSSGGSHAHEIGDATSEAGLDPRRIVLVGLAVCSTGWSAIGALGIWSALSGGGTALGVVVGGLVTGGARIRVRRFLAAVGRGGVAIGPPANGGR